VTSYEDLPADLFGEPDAAPEHAPSRGAPAADANGEPSSEAADEAAPADLGRPPTSAAVRPSPAGSRAPAADGAAGDGAAEGEERSPIAMVRSLFPGRIVALEPLATDEADEAEAGDEDGPPAETDGPEGGPGDGPSRGSG
jgi:hypothetical protein